MCNALCAVAVWAAADDMFLTPRFVPKTIEELRGQGTDAAELARQEARLKQQVHDEMVWPAHNQDAVRISCWRTASRLDAGCRSLSAAVVRLVSEHE